MAPAIPLYLSRSDGKLLIDDKGKTIRNGPTDRQLDGTPDANGAIDYYREISYDEPKHWDWRRKLGTMLIRQIRQDPESRNMICFLDAFPENYRLYEHIKSSGPSKDGKTKSVKTHAGGGHDRQDAYLYGHPFGKNKRFRSPSDFFPHLLWLATDEKGDRDNCTCKVCSPDELQIDEKGAPRDLKATKKEIKKEREGSQATAPTAASPGPANRRTSIPTTAASTTAKRPAAVPAAASLRSSSNAAPAPTPIPQPRCTDQQIDAAYDKFIFRPGEIVWFQRGPDWFGLGAVSCRFQQTDHQGRVQPKYAVYPLSDPHHHQRGTIKVQTEVRPWLSCSPPDFTHPGLRGGPYYYEHIDWNGVNMGRYGEGTAEIDGSISAARTLDETYAPFHNIKRVASTQTGGEDCYWNGIFIGNEKIWVGEPVRVQLSGVPGIQILIITDIIERGVGTSLHPALEFVGDLHQFTTFQCSPQTNPQTLPSDRHLPFRMREDLQFRNSHSIPRGSAYFYRLIHAGAKIGLASVKGRWYEASVLTPILDKDFQVNLKSGIIKDIGDFMNVRGRDLPMERKTGTRVDDRRRAIGRALDQSVTFMDGVMVPDAAELAALTGANDQNHQGGHAFDQQMADANNPIDEFMDLGGMDSTEFPGFGQEFPQGGTGHFFQ